VQLIVIFWYSEATRTIFHIGDGLYVCLILNRLVDGGFSQLLAVGNKKCSE